MKSSRKFRRRRSLGQTTTEYVLIIAVVVVAAVGILGLFSDTLREKIAGIVRVFDSDADVEEQIDENSEELLRQLDREGLPE